MYVTLRGETIFGIIIIMTTTREITQRHTYITTDTNIYFPLELYVYITLTNNYLEFFIYQLIILWTISIN